jgi:hypothetical protein
MITLEMFTKFFYILGFDLRPDIQEDDEHICLPRRGNERIKALFKNSHPETVTCIFYAEFPEHIVIYCSRNVTIE